MTENKWEAPGFLYFFRFFSSKRHRTFLYLIYTAFLTLLFLDSVYAVNFPWPVVVAWALFIGGSLYLIHHSYRSGRSAGLALYLLSCMCWWAGAVLMTGGGTSPLFHYAQVLLILGAFSASLRVNLIGGVIYISTLAVSITIYPVNRADILALVSESAIHLLTLAFGCLIAVAMNSYLAWTKHWQQQAHTDHLTGLANRQGLLQWWEKRKPTEGWLVVMDLNEFKMVNDTYGHGRGDQILVFLAEELQQSLPSQAFAARIGGDEFMLYLPANIDKSTAAQNIQQHMQQAGKRAHISITAALGFVPITPNDCDFQSLYQKADIDMYRQKKHAASSAGEGASREGKQV